MARSGRTAPQGLKPCGKREADRSAQSAAPPKCAVQQPLRLPCRVLAPRDLYRQDQQAEQEQGADQGKQGVQRVEMEVGIAIEAISCREHKTSLARVTGANGGRSEEHTSELQSLRHLV